MPDAEAAATENGAEAGRGMAEAAAAGEPSTADGPAPMETEAAEAPKVEEPKEEVVKKKRSKKLQVPFKMHVEDFPDKVVQVSVPISPAFFLLRKPACCTSFHSMPV